MLRRGNILNQLRFFSNAGFHDDTVTENNTPSTTEFSASRFTQRWFELLLTTNVCFLLSCLCLALNGPFLFGTDAMVLSYSTRWMKNEHFHSYKQNSSHELLKMRNSYKMQFDWKRLMQRNKATMENWVLYPQDKLVRGGLDRGLFMETQNLKILGLRQEKNNTAMFSALCYSKVMDCRATDSSTFG